jgi:protein-S-isoprenylcysteine O-methyltransferase Ste14
MDHETMFRSIFAILTIALYGIRLAYKKDFPKQKKIEGFGEILVTVSTRLWALGLVAYLWGISWLSFQISLLEGVRWFGVGIFTLCLPISAWTYRTLGIHFSTKLQLLENHQLVSSGPYRFVRHPMYATLFLSVLAACLISGNLIVVATSVMLVFAIVLRIKREDAMLEERFGETYRKYAKSTGTITPKLRIFH